jgi:hypothetical protein
MGNKISASKASGSFAAVVCLLMADATHRWKAAAGMHNKFNEAEKQVLVEARVCSWCFACLAMPSVNRKWHASTMTQHAFPL